MKMKKGFCRLGRPGGDLLSHVLRRSTIGAGDFNDRVRNGIGWRLPANATGPAKTTDVRDQRSGVGDQRSLS